MRDQSPMTRLRDANPVASQSAIARSSRRGLRRSSQALLAVFAALVLGVGAAWAAGGINPVATLFGQNFEIVESDYGLDSFSVLRPASEDDFQQLPRHAAFMATSIALSNVRGSDFSRKEFSDAVGAGGPPVELSAIGFGTAATGSKVTLMVLEGQICVAWDFGGGVCGDLESLVRTGSIVNGYGERGTQLTRLQGIAVDGVKSVRVVGSKIPPTPVIDNVFEFRNMKPENLRLEGLDEEGNKILEMSAPIAVWAGA